jgi:hypothetical protein
MVTHTPDHTVVIGPRQAALEVPPAWRRTAPALCGMLVAVPSPAVSILALTPAGDPSFDVSIAALTLVQALLVTLSRVVSLPALARFRSGWCATLPVASVVGFVFGVQALSGAADGLTYLALFAVPPLAALALGAGIRGARAWLAPLAALLFALAWADRGGLAGEAAAVALEGLSCVTLGVLLVAVTPRLLVKLSVLAMAGADLWLVASTRLNAPNNALNNVVPVAHLPQLQSALLGSAVMGYGDLFVAALLGALLASQPRLAVRGALVAAAVGLALDLLFFFVDELPATASIALTLLILEAWGRWRGRPSSGVLEPAA